MELTLYIDSAVFNRMTMAHHAEAIAYGRPISPLRLGSREYIITGGMVGPYDRHGNTHGWHYVNGYPVVDQVAYTGLLEPLPYNEHNRQVDRGLRKRGYPGMLINVKKRPLVVVEPRIEFRDFYKCTLGEIRISPPLAPTPVVAGIYREQSR